jgi:hypothetical protein
MTMPKVPDEFASLDGTSADTETKSPTTEAEEVNGGLLWSDGQDGKLDATDIVDADIEKRRHLS